MSSAKQPLRHTDAILHLNSALPIDVAPFLRKYEIHGASSPRLLVMSERKESMEEFAFMCHRRLAAFVRHGLKLTGTTLAMGLLVNPQAVMTTIPVPLDLMTMLSQHGATCEIVTYIGSD